MTAPHTAGEHTAMVLDSEIALSGALVQMLHLDHPGPSEHLFCREGVYWIDLCLTPRRPQARGCFVDRWAAHRFSGMGMIIAIPPNQTVHMMNAGGRHSSLICQVDREAVDRWLPADFEWTDRRLEACLDITSETIRGLLRRLAREFRGHELASEEIMGSIAFQLSIEIARYLTAMNEPAEQGGLSSWRLRVIENRLSELGSPPTLVELAALCNMSPRQLTRGFRTSRGCSIREHMSQLRIETAKRRLASGEMIKVVALSLGFASQSNFTYAFRSLTGVTPGEFRSRVSRKT